MKKIHRLLYILILFGLTQYSYAQKRGIESITIKELKEHLEFLASDELEGRCVGTEGDGLEKAAGYLAKNAEEIGLRTGFSGYVQRLKIIRAKQNPGQSSLTLMGPNNETILKTDSLIGLTREYENIELNKEIIFCGFGRKDTITGLDEFEEKDIAGKIAMYVAGSPDTYKQELNGKDIRFDNSLEGEKWNRAKEKGAAGVIILNSPMNPENINYARLKNIMQRSSWSVSAMNQPESQFVLAFAPPSVYDAVVGEKGALKIELTRRMLESKQEKRVNKKTIAEIHISNEKTEYEGKNIVGLIEGSDSLLKNECLVFMAHYDHLGVDSKGNVFNGADDNGSGSVTLLELAEAFNTLEQKPKRSIVFLWVTCEELGMLGSHYYSDNPLFPMEKTVACINLDMVGRVYEKRDDVWKKSPKIVKGFNELYCLMGNETENLVKINDSAFEKAGLIPDKSLPAQFLRSSDHYYFYNKGVPVINYATGYHKDYHKVTDEVSKINFKKIKKVAELCFYAGYEIANQ